MRKIGKKNVVRVDVSNYDYLILGTPGIGKTTLAYELGRTLGGEEGALLLQMGNENGCSHLPNAFYEEIKTFEALEEAIEALVLGRRTDYADTKFIVIDTLDELIRLAEDHTVREFNRSVEASKRVKTIKGAYGGFNAGVEHTRDKIVSTLWKLREVGYSLVFIGHTKTKTTIDPVSEIEFTQLTCTASKQYYNAINSKVHISCVAYVKREFNQLEKVTKQDIVTKQKYQVEKGKVGMEKRVITFRDSDYVIDTKSRFPEIVSEIEFSSENFIKAITDAVNEQVKKQLGAVTPEAVEQVRLTQEAEQQAKTETIQQTLTTPSREELITRIYEAQATVTNEKKQHVLMILKESKLTSIKDASIDILQQIHCVLSA